MEVVGIYEVGRYMVAEFLKYLFLVKKDSNIYESVKIVNTYYFVKTKKCTIQ